MSFWGVNLLFKYNLIVLLNDFSLYVPFQKTLNYLCYLSNYETVQIFCCLFIIINFIPLFFFCKVWNRQLSLSLHCCPKIQLLVLMLCWNMTMWWRIGEAPTSQQRGYLLLLTMDYTASLVPWWVTQATLYGLLW